MGKHEDELLEVLEKLGQPAAPHPNNAPVLPAVEDGDSPDYLTETAGASEPPVPADPVAESAPKIEGTPERPRYAPVTKTNIWVHHDAHPVVLDVLLLNQYKTEWFTWSPETLWKEIKEDFRVPSIHDHVKAKIQAMKTLHITDSFWKQWEVFCWINQALNNNIPDFRVLQKPSLSQLLNSVDIATLTRNDSVFALDIQDFVAAAVVEDGVFYVPEPIQFCQDEIETLLTRIQIEDASSTIKAVQKRFDELRSYGPDFWTSTTAPVLEENVVDVQAAKLLVAWNYLSMRRQQMQKQLELL